MLLELMDIFSFEDYLYGQLLMEDLLFFELVLDIASHLLFFGGLIELSWILLAFPWQNHLQNLEGNHPPLWTKNPQAHYVELLVTRPRVVRRLRTKANFCWDGQPFHDLFLGSAPGRGVSEDLRHIREHGGAGPHYSDVTQVVFSATSWNVCMVCMSCVVGVGAAPLTTSNTVLPLDQS